MNLTTDKWIPVVWQDGRADKVSLLDVFQQGARIRDLAVRPHERIALMRLLICVAQAALDGPKDGEDWKNCRQRLPQAAVDYLAQWQHAFELFGDGQRFLQVEEVTLAKDKNGEDNSPSKLDLVLASGNNSTLFDNAGGAVRVFSHAELALMLLTYQNFSPGGLISDVTWNGRAMGRSSTHAPCVMKGMLHAYVTKQCMLDSIAANLVTRVQIDMLSHPWGKPVWEAMPHGADTAEVPNTVASYLGRLVPVSRAVRLGSSGCDMIMGAGVTYSPDWREVAGTIVIRERAGKPERTALSASISKSVWREAHSLAVVATAENQMLGGPLALMLGLPDDGADIWTGALLANKSKLIDAVESTIHIPSKMLEDASRVLYQEGVAHAEDRGRRINKAISVFRTALHDEIDRPELRNRGMAVKQKAASHYWTAVEQRLPALLAIVEDPSLLRPEGAVRDNWAGTQWGKAVARAAREAYELACPHETPRQLKAYALGLSVLFKQDVEKTEEPETEETGT